MAENSSSLPEPGYIDEAESLLGKPFFGDQLSAEALYYKGIASLRPEAVEERRLLYTSLVRVLATARRCDRLVTANLDPNYSVTDWNNNWSHSLTTKKLSQIACNKEAAEIINNARQQHQALEAHYTPAYNKTPEQGDELRPHQHLYMDDILNFLRADAQEITVDIDGQKRRHTVHGALVVAPTGSGKTALIGATAKGVGIGKEQAENGRKTRMAIVVPSTNLIEQFTGKMGNQTFKRFAGNLSVGAFYAPEKIDNTDVVVMTIEQFNKHFRNNALNGNTFDLLCIDEAHHLTEPKFLATFLENWNGPTLGFTATPSYRPGKDVRSILPSVIKHADLISYIHEGVVNAAQIFMVAADAELDTDLGEADQIDKGMLNELRRQIINQAVVEFVQPLVDEGRRGIIFCERGKECEHAEQLAAQFRELRTSDGRQIHAAALHSWDPKDAPAKKILNEYHEGKIDVMTAVGMAQEGFDGQVDFVIIAHTPSSRLKLIQEIGRGTRLSNEFPTTVYAQFLAPSLERNNTKYSIYEAFGLDAVAEGHLLSRTPASKRRSRIRSDHERVMQLSSFPESLQKIFARINYRPLNEVLVHYKRNEVIPPDYVDFDHIFAQVKDKITVKSAKYRLDAAGYEWRGRVEQTPHGYVLRRYYEPAAGTFFSAEILPPRATPDMRSYADLIKELDISQTFLKRLITTNETPFNPVRRIGSNGRVAHFFREADDVKRIREIIGKIPTASSTDISLTPLAEELGISEDVVMAHAKELGINSVYKRRVDKKGFAPFITAEEAEQIREKTEQHPWATKSEWSIPRIAKEIGVAPSTVRQRLTSEERSAAVLRRTFTDQNFVRALEHWPITDAQKIMERIADFNQSLPPDLVPVSAILKALGMPTGSVPAKQFVQGYEVSYVQLPGTRKSKCYPWGVLRDMVAHIGLGKDIEPIDFTRLPTGPDDTDPAKVAYAREVQLRFFTAERLGLTLEKPVPPPPVTQPEAAPAKPVAPVIPAPDRPSLPESEHYSLTQLQTHLNCSKEAFAEILRGAKVSRADLVEQDEEVTHVKGSILPRLEAYCSARIRIAEPNWMSREELLQRTHLDDAALERIIRLFSAAARKTCRSKEGRIDIWYPIGITQAAFAEAKRRSKSGQ